MTDTLRKIHIKKNSTKQGRSFYKIFNLNWNNINRKLSLLY